MVVVLTPFGGEGGQCNGPHISRVYPIILHTIAYFPSPNLISDWRKDRGEMCSRNRKLDIRFSFSPKKHHKHAFFVKFSPKYYNFWRARKSMGLTAIYSNTLLTAYSYPLETYLRTCTLKEEE